MSADDQALIRGVLEGDESSFRLLYRRHTPRLRQIVLRHVGEPCADADDVVQETWIRAATQLRTFRGESAFRTWLIGIAVRVSYEVLRRRRRGDTSRPEALETPDRPVPIGDQIDLERALATLSDQHRAVLLLHDLEGFTHEEIAAQLGVAPGTSKAQLFHARRAMRRMLGDPQEAAHEPTA